MSVQIDQIFTAKAESVWQFLNTAGQGCYVPAYQRPYAWDEANADRLFDDVLNGLDHLMTRPEAISFLGTIIAIHDVKNITVKPALQGQVAPRVMTLIDGQQRISTSVMMNIVLHRQVSELASKLEREQGAEFEWIDQDARTALANLSQTFALDQATGKPEVYKYYPRVIRAFDDTWSRNGKDARYNSPVAKLIWSYIKHIFDQPAATFEYKGLGEDKKPDPNHQPLAQVFNHLARKIQVLSTGKDAESEFPNLQQAVQDANFMQALWSFKLPSEVVEFVTQKSDHKKYAPYCALLRTLVFEKYFNRRMALTIVTTRSEEDAFDMFEALNTTGEPLTAFETFKPRIIEAETLEEYEMSPSYQSVSQVEKYLHAYKKADERQRASSELLIPFALAETGEKLQKSLSDQRRYLRDYFDPLGTLDEKRSVVGALACTSDFVRTGWQSSETPLLLEEYGVFDKEAGFCFHALRALKHAIVVGALARFYGEYRNAHEDAARQARREDLEGAIKAIAAFSMLWRGGYGSTNNIDAIYRAIMREGLSEQNILPIARRPKSKDGKVLGAVSISGLKRMLWARFVEKFPTRQNWINAASSVPIYKDSVAVAKFLSIVAGDDAVPDPKTPGSILRGKKGVAPTITDDAWGADAHVSVEHIAPQVKKDGWDTKLYDDPQTIHRLGNLTLLPMLENGYVGARPWAHKKLLYRYLSASTEEEMNKVFAEFASAGLQVSKAGDEVLKSGQYLPMCRALAQVVDAWSVEVVAARSSVLAGLAYDRVIGWLKPEIGDSQA